MKLRYSSPITFLFIASLLFATGCSEELNRIGSQVLSSTGVVSSSQADSIFAAGSKLSKAVESVSDEQEYYLGRAVAATILSKYPPVEDSSLTTYLNKVASVLAAHSSRPETFGGYHVAVINTSEINALSAPGGYIFVSKGFVQLLTTEDELAAVLAHEIGHIANKDGLSAISSSNLTGALQIIGKEAASASMSGSPAFNQLNEAFGSSVNEVAGTLLDKGYSRSQEYSADAYAVTLLQRTGYKVSSVKSVLEKLDNVTNQSGGWFETHPSAHKREGELASATDSPASLKGESVRNRRFKAAVRR